MEEHIRIEELKKYFPASRSFWGTPKTFVHAVDGVSFSIRRGETLGLVGESGSGKTTVARTLLGLTPPTSGRVIFEGEDLFSLRKSRLKEFRGRMGIVFQDPSASLNPRLTVYRSIAEPVQTHRDLEKKAQEAKVLELLEAVGLGREHVYRYPNEFSGGQQQRIGIARALSIDPSFIMFDEPTSALDVSVQAQVLNLILDLKNRYAFTGLFISHDLLVVRHVADRIIVMYLGVVVESGPAERLFRDPLHPYTRALLSALPVPRGGAKKERIILRGGVPSSIDIPPGCRFAERCGMDKVPACTEIEPVLKEVEKGRYAACHLL